MIREVAFILSLFLVQPALAEPVVIYDSGTAIPVYPYKMPLEGLEIPDFGDMWARETSVKAVQSDPNDPANWLPVTTNKLSLGDFESRTVTFNQIANPICIIGSDDRSIEWIERHHSALLANDVLCWLVSADTVADVQRVVNALDGISMSPANGDSLADFFVIDHYPVLITQRFIEQ
jgi:integrating conjugative element protein (TIGR03765 family)